MLSISNVTAKMASSYYEKDGYYARDMQDGDRWQGRLCKQLALPIHSLEPKQFNELVLQNPKRAGFDLAFSAPKSVSVAMVMNEEMKKDMLTCHNKAVEKILHEIEVNEIAARITKNGITETIQTGNMACGKFNHYVSRNSDMQLHTHAVILNKTMYNEKIYAVSNESIYQNKILYGQLYRNELAKNLQKKGYPLELTDHEKGFFELKGVEPEMLDRFSTRRQEILQQLKVWNVDDAVNASKAALLSRRAKEHRDLGVLTESWRESILKAGGTQLEKVNEPIKIRKEDKLNAFDQAVARLSEHEYAFSKRDLERAVLAEGCISGMTRVDFEKQLDKSYLICLGKPITHGEDIYYTSPGNQAAELQITQNIIQSQGTVNALSEEKVKNALSEISKEHGLTLSQEQTEAVLHISTSKDRFSAVQGLAGTGKTYMLFATREVLEKSGYNVVGASYTGKAAEGLQEEAKIKSSTIHSLLNKLEKEAGNAIADEDFSQKKTWNFEGLVAGKKPEIWVIDEAGLTDNNIMLHLQTAAKFKKAKVVLVGDYQQLAPVGAGNSYSNLVQSGKISTCYLSDIRRQKNETLLQAVKESVTGDIHKSLELVADRTFEIPSASKRFKAITKEYTELSPTEQNNTIVLTAKNKDRIAINDSIRVALIKKGDLGNGIEYKIQTGKSVEHARGFSVGDKIMFFKNDYKLGVMNGQLGKVINASEGQLVVETNNKAIKVNTEEYNHFDHGYAMTTHKAQGMTVDRAIINIDSTQKKLNSRNNYYVDISRARNEISIYTDSKKLLREQIGEFTKKLVSTDFAIRSILNDRKIKLSNKGKMEFVEKTLSRITSVAKKIDYQRIRYVKTQKFYK